MGNSSPNASPDWVSRISFRRIITSNRFIPEIDGFRFLAILIVVISHIMIQCDAPQGSGVFAHLFTRAFYGAGGHGVYLFFTISGFILALPFARHHLLGTKPVALGSYFLRRITRLEPPYVISMLMRAAILAIGYTSAGSLGSLGLHLLASLFYLHGPIFAHIPTINPPAWSLEIEIQFYILAPFLTSVFLIKSVPLRRAVILIVILLSGYGSMYIHGPERLVFTLLNFFQYFAAGFMLVDLYLTKTHLSIPPLIWDLIGFTSLAWILLSQNMYYPVILPLVTICLYMSGFYGRLVHGFFSLPVISMIGGMCYSIYLTHTAVLTGVNVMLLKAGVHNWPAPAQTAVIYLVSTAGVLALGSLFFLLIERPCMDPHWPQQLSAWLRRSPKPAPEPVT
jgi:peptidoglycan/LPS O-acetylase OafA/YrhL